MVTRIVAVELLAVALFILVLTYSARTWPTRGPVKREHFIDVVKGIAILCVIGIHVTSLVPQLAWLSGVLWAGLGFFVIASGYVLQLQYGEVFDAKRFFSRTATRILIPYVLFSILFLALAGTVFADYPAGLLFGRANGNFYFIPLLISLYALYPLLRLAKRWLFTPVGLFGVYCFSLYFGHLHYVISLAQWNANEWSLIFFARFLFYFVIGMFLAEFDLTSISLNQMGPSVLVAVAGMIAATSIVGGFFPLNLYPVTAFLCLLMVYAVSAPAWSWLASLGPHTLYMYLLHTPLVFNYGGPTLAHALSGTPLLAFSAVLVAVTLVSYAVARAILWSEQRWQQRQAR